MSYPKVYFRPLDGPDNLFGWVYASADSKIWRYYKYGGRAVWELSDIWPPSLEDVSSNNRFRPMPHVRLLPWLFSK